MLTDKDRRHAELAAAFCCQLGVAFVAGAFLQLIVPSIADGARAATLFMIGFLIYGAGHVVLERAFGDRL